MQVQFAIHGTINLPEGTRISRDYLRLLILPDGGSIAVNPIIEYNPDPAGDDHRNLSHEESQAIGVAYEMEQRIINEITPITFTLADFHIGSEFELKGVNALHRVTDVGTRTITYITVGQKENSDSSLSPPDIEKVLDEHRFVEVCNIYVYDAIENECP